MFFSTASPVPALCPPGVGAVRARSLRALRGLFAATARPGGAGCGYREPVARITLTERDLELTIDTELGGGVRSLVARGPHGWAHLLRPAPADRCEPSDLAAFVMMPWCNRVAGARFAAGGREHQLNKNWPDGTAIHGEVWRVPLRILERTPVSVVLTADSAGFPRDRASAFPVPYRGRVRYELLPNGVVIDLGVTNLGQEPAPFGLGLHPFFARAPFAAGDGPVVRMRAAGRYLTRAQIPTGPPTSDDAVALLAAGDDLGRVRLDDVFAGVQGFVLEYPAAGRALACEMSERLRHVVVYSPGEGDRAAPYVAVEPCSMANDGFNLHEGGMHGTGVVVLGPGETLEGSINFQLRTTP